MAAPNQRRKQHGASAALVQVVVRTPNHWFLPAESLWARRIGRGQYELANIPFFAYDLNLGDVVRARPTEDSLPEVHAIVRRSGNQTLRVIFDQALTEPRRTAARAKLERLASGSERWDDSYLALSVDGPGPLAAVEAALVSMSRRRVLSYETCEARVPGSFDGVPLGAPESVAATPARRSRATRPPASPVPSKRAAPKPRRKPARARSAAAKPPARATRSRKR